MLFASGLMTLLAAGMAVDGLLGVMTEVRDDDDDDARVSADADTETALAVSGVDLLDEVELADDLDIYVDAGEDGLDIAVGVDVADEDILGVDTAVALDDLGAVPIVEDFEPGVDKLVLDFDPEFDIPELTFDTDTVDGSTLVMGGTTPLALLDGVTGVALSDIVIQDVDGDAATNSQSAAFWGEDATGVGFGTGQSEDINTGVDAVRFGAGLGDDTVNAGSQDDVIFGGGGDDWLGSGNGDDTIHGGLGDDLIHGGSHDDHLIGGEGSDTLIGGAGSDTLDGLYTDDPDADDGDVLRAGTGDDLLILGAGDKGKSDAGFDTIVSDTDVGADVPFLTDFNPDEDVIELLYDPAQTPNPVLTIEEVNAAYTTARIYLDGEYVLRLLGSGQVTADHITLVAKS